MPPLGSGGFVLKRLQNLSDGVSSGILKGLIERSKSFLFCLLLAQETLLCFFHYSRKIIKNDTNQGRKMAGKAQPVKRRCVNTWMYCVSVLAIS